MDAVEIIAHRGSSFLAPENTQAAFDLAWQEQADAVEGDFRLTRDGQIVALHDAGLKRTAAVDRRVNRLSLAELRACDVGAWKGPQFAGQRVPTLREVLEKVPLGKQFFVEVKCGPEIIEPLYECAADCGSAAEKMVLISLRLPVISALKQALPRLPAYWVVEFMRDEAGHWLPRIDDTIRLAKAAKLDGLDLGAAGPIDAKLVKRIKKAGLRLCVWTVDDPAVARRLVDLGVEGITTNRPGWLREQLQLGTARR